MSKLLHLDGDGEEEVTGREQGRGEQEGEGVKKGKMG